MARCFGIGRAAFAVVKKRLIAGRPRIEVCGALISGHSSVHKKLPPIPDVGEAAVFFFSDVYFSSAGFIS
jgi:hypothetical protein